MQLMKKRSAWFPLDDEKDNIRWGHGHRRWARAVLSVAQDLRGWWVKVGQYMSTRGDVMPSEWVQELRVLQDSNPTDSSGAVEVTIEQELGAPIAELFSSFSSTPLASASIAQVHRATLRATGQQVVVKVQHRNIDAIMKQDLVNLSAIVRWIAYYEPTCVCCSAAWLVSRLVTLHFNLHHIACNPFLLLLFRTHTHARSLRAYFHPTLVLSAHMHSTCTRAHTHTHAFSQFIQLSDSTQ